MGVVNTGSALAVAGSYKTGMEYEYIEALNVPT